ncbi:MAG: DNA-directed RNA polymerase subunit beta [Akkermansiaceae bacterium]|jgi:DNA-directed RNA polymerase subunit beta|nr:DNA-directed RNA polymerase subunit beta [Akkermansiaceae bacterium]MDP4647158.1 DNA-directed RNA polymerase subunit beta [Akkermansiaceae bacterium]MDP4720030.1 DNA-directed RNA polymerase subunit beta [Akkermansiaceae bacterium]MDP4780452.1 DNA-directed RNA polymerase subunit beta [Akkermansiaceae bacterium]MDP4847769.1 DNA-directed RNA polymerase subunit beta [Akkermansiaceae bacterium]
MAERLYFGKFEEVIDPPNLIEVQSRSYDEFLQKDASPGDRSDTGLQAVFREVFPIKSYDEAIELDFVAYDIEDPKMTSLDSLRNSESFSAALYVTFKLKDETGTKKERVYMGELPMMTRRGTFIINGAERVIVSQLHRSPGICFETSQHLNGKMLHSFRIIPDRGSWLEVQFDTNDLLYVYLDRRRRRRKFLATTFLRVLGYPTDRDIVSHFYSIENLALNSKIDEAELGHKVPFEDILDGELVIAKAYEPLTAGIVKQLTSLGHKKLEVIDGREDEILLKSLRKDPAKDEESALKDIYRKLRPGDPPTASNARALLKRLFFDAKKYDLTRVGRYKINQKLGIGVDSDQRIMVPEDFLAAVRYILKLKKGEGVIDDIDHLGSRRVRAVGELLANQCRVGLARTERLVKERMTLFDVNIEGMTPQKLINPKALSAVVRDFFGRSQLSQFMDQTNPLAELTHKRRLSALGPGGLNRDRAGFEVRDVHPSHYGRICPIETPEGPNIGLINSMCTYARINEFGFIETPYRKVKKGKVTNEIEYLTADQEENYLIAQASNVIDKNGKFDNDRIDARERGEFIESTPDAVHYMDVSPKQLVSVAAGLIPFLEHDDANRALMGSNMQRQGVPLLVSESPFVGTGLEGKAARDSRAVVVSEADGIVAAATAEIIITTPDGKLPVSDEKFLSEPEVVKTNVAKGIFAYPLRKFMRSNAGTCINQKPIVKAGQKIKKGTVLADGPNTEDGELAIGRNVLVAFMPWNGYNFEDAIVISERVVKDDVYTSIHISEFDVAARDTKLGPEEITRDIPNVGEEALRNLDHDGIIRIGAEVKPGDILVGKITPKSETELAPEERLLRAIFGEKAADVKDTSLRVPSGCTGIVQDVRVSSHGLAKKRAEKVDPAELKKHLKKINDEHKKKADKLTDDLTEKLSDILLGEKIPLDVVNAQTGEIIIPANRKITKTLLRKLASVHDHIEIDPSPIRNKIVEIVNSFESRFSELDTDRERKLDQLESGDDIDPGVIKEVKVFVAAKRKLSVGDKMAGRHGNKGVVATIVPEEDMPYLHDGTPVDICLNPLGVPSRMNVGQVLETHLGVAAKALGFKVATPIFDGIKEQAIWDFMSEAKKVDGVKIIGDGRKAVERKPNQPETPGYTWIGDGKDGSTAGKSTLYDGRTGEAFHNPIVVGYIYMLKLGHLVADKIHARAVGPYSLVTQQPLGGKAQYGGQRFGEMEVWALEAYGAAYTLQEILTVKSDDVQGRTRIYEAIVKGDNNLEAGTPESFNVLIKEMQSLGLDVRPGRQGQTSHGSPLPGSGDDFSLDDLTL